MTRPLREATPDDAAEAAGVPVWCLPGSRVGVIGSYSSSRTVKLHKVNSVGKRYVVLDNGDRFDKRTLRRSIEAYGWSYVLVDPKGDRWRTEVAANNQLVLLRRMRGAVDRLDAAEDLPAAAEDLIRMIAPLTTRSDAILAALEPTERKP